MAVAGVRPAVAPGPRGKRKIHGVRKPSGIRGSYLKRNAGKGSDYLKFQNFSLILNGKMDFTRTMPGGVVQTSSGPQPRWGWLTGGNGFPG